MLRFVVTPKFWNDESSKLVKFLSPFSKLYSFVSNAKLNNVTPEKSPVPVICVGNVVIGGAGKTPTVELVCNILKESSFNPHVLTAGYGGYLKNVVKVDPELHSYLQVGDEALLSAKVAPTWIGRNRVNSGRAAVLAGANILVMDDGFQNNSLEKDFKILVVDSKQKFGNEHILPAGPLRETVQSGVKKSDAVMIIGDKSEYLEERIRQVKTSIPIFYSKMKVTNSITIENKKVIGFCGLGYPSKFKQTLIDCGYEIMDFISFSDHHPYTITEIQKLIRAAKDANATLVTTMKDYVKIPGVFKNEISIIEVKLVTENDEFKNLLLDSLEKLKSHP